MRKMMKNKVGRNSIIKTELSTSVTLVLFSCSQEFVHKAYSFSQLSNNHHYLCFAAPRIE